MSVLIKRCSFLCAFLFMVSVNVASAAEWSLNTNKDGIRVQSQPTASGYAIFRGTIDLDTNLSTLVSIIRAPGVCPDLIFSCKSGKVIEQTSKSVRLDYVLIDGPLLMDDRDLYIHSVGSYDKAAKTVLIRMSGRENHDVGQPGRIRVKDFQGFWRFQELTPGKVRVTYQTYSDPQIPGGRFLNGILSDSVFYSLQNMRKLTQSAKYRTDVAIESLM